MRLAGLDWAGGGGEHSPSSVRSLAHPGARREGRAPGVARGGHGSQAWVRSQGSEQPEASGRWAQADPGGRDSENRGQGLTQPARVSHGSGAQGQGAVGVGSSPGVSSWLAASLVSSHGLSSVSSGDRALASHALFLPPSRASWLMGS